MAPARISPGVDAAWQIGADLALRSGSEFIEPIHLLYGIFNLTENLIGAAKRAPSQLDEIRTEAAELAKLCSGAEPNLADLRHDVWNPPPANRTMSRSSALKQIFADAQFAAERDGSPSVTVVTLLRELIASADASVFDRISDSLRQRLCEQFHAKPSPPIADIQISQSFAADERVPQTTARATNSRFELLCELSWEFGVKSRIEPVLQGFCEQLLKLIPTAERTSVLFCDSMSGELLLKAHAPTCPHRISLTCAKQAINERKSLLWQRTGELTASQISSDLQSGIYVPLIAEREVLGVICLDTSEQAAIFSDDDLYFATAVAHQLALAIANRHLQVKLASNAEVMERLLTNFSPQVRKRLLQRAQQGRLKLGGERSEVSVLCSDIRGFTRLTATMDTEDIVNMLNEYFSALTDCIFRNDGTVDKFVGDAILAVFGSPDPDSQHRRKAVQAAVDMQAAMVEVNRRRALRSDPVCEIGIGVHSGEVLHGFIGSVERMEFTVIGDTVNKTARYCDGAKAAEVLISPEVHQHVWRMVDAKPVSISTKHEGDLAAYHVVALRPS